MASIKSISAQALRQKDLKQALIVDVRSPMNPLFTPITLKGLTLTNRIVIPPMDQYSATDGEPGPWHGVLAAQ